MSFSISQSLLISVLYTIVFGIQALAHPSIDLHNGREENIGRSVLGMRNRTSQPIPFRGPTFTNTRLPETALSISSTKNTKRADVIDNTGLRLRISKSRVTDVNGFTLTSIPIPLPELVSLLLETYTDLSLYQSQIVDTNFYQFNGTAWCLKVVATTKILPLFTISLIVKTFLMSMVGRYPSKLSWTPIACLYKDDTPIAEIAILPWTANEAVADIHFDSSNASSIPTIPANIMTLSPAGAISTTEIISSNALDVYATSPATNLPKRVDFAGEIVVRVFNTALYVVRRINFNAEVGNAAARALPYILEAAVLVALNSLALGIVAEAANTQWYDIIFGKLFFLDSGSYRIGKMLVRFCARATARDAQGNPLGFAAETWDALATALSTVLRNAPQLVPVYAVGGEINGLDTVNQTGKTVQLGQWQIKVGPAPDEVHDEL
ncbi:MAG: hypothetical protein Q9174_004070 [Haloplaca sp. 1 TL-2023]